MAWLNQFEGNKSKKKAKFVTELVADAGKTL